jgi:hypothetical protein
VPLRLCENQLKQSQNLKKREKLRLKNPQEIHKKIKTPAKPGIE